MNVVVLEKNEYIGGAAVSRELQEGFKYSSCSYVCSMMRQAIHRDLDLGRHGLLLVPYLGGVSFGDGDERLFSYHDEEAAHHELKRHSPRDADAMHRFQTDLTRYSQFIRKTLLRTPPDPTSFKPRDIMEFLYLGKQIWALGEKEIYEYVRFFTMSAAEYLEDYFENDLVFAILFIHCSFSLTIIIITFFSSFFTFTLQHLSNQFPVGKGGSGKSAPPSPPPPDETMIATTATPATAGIPQIMGLNLPLTLKGSVS